MRHVPVEIAWTRVLITRQTFGEVTLIVTLDPLGTVKFIRFKIAACVTVMTNWMSLLSTTTGAIVDGGVMGG